MIDNEEVKKPKLYNWVRAIKKISLISAVYTILVMLACIVLFYKTNTSGQAQTLHYSLITTLLSTLLLTIGIRKILLRKITEKLQARISFELILTTWCIFLILIHLQCQLIFLMLFQASVDSLMAYLAFASASLVIYLTWPNLKKIQSLLQRPVE